MQEKIQIKEKEKDKDDDSLKGFKDDLGKPKLSLLFRQFPLAMKAIVTRAEYGHTKYITWDADYKNWERVGNPLERYSDAGLRHFADYLAGEEIDEESGQPHLWAALWCFCAVTQIEEKLKKEKDGIS